MPLIPEPPSTIRPFGLTLAVPASTSAVVDSVAFEYDEAAQIGVVRDGEALVPLLRHTDGTTNTVTDGGDGQHTNKDSDSDHRED